MDKLAKNASTTLIFFGMAVGILGSVAILIITVAAFYRVVFN